MKRTAKQLFKVPDSYFESRTSDSYKAMEQQPLKSKRTSKRITIYYAVASVAALLIGLALPLYQADGYRNLESENIENYLQQESLWVSSTLESQLTEEDLEVIRNQIELDAEDVKDYLLTRTDLEYILID